MGGFTDQFVSITARIVEIMAALVVGYGAITAFYKIIIKSSLNREEYGQYERARIDLGRKLVIGLEFELGADLLQTAINPTWSHIGVLGAIILLRTILNFVLERDIQHAEERISKGQQIQINNS